MPMDTALREELRQLIEERLAALGQRAADSETRSQAVELDQARVGRLSRMDALQQQAMQDATEARNRVQLLRLQAALARIDDDDFGYCRECDEPIAPGRLRIDPAASLCVGCADLEGG